MTEPSYQIFRAAGQLRLAGDFDINARAELYEELVCAIKQCSDGRVVVDFEATEFLDSEALGALLDGLNTSREAGIKMSVVNAQGIVHRVLEVSGVLDLFD